MATIFMEMAVHLAFYAENSDREPVRPFAATCFVHWLTMRGLRYVLRTGATVFGLSALALILFPAFFLELLGLEATSPLVWSMVMIGITLIALTGNMAVVSIFANDKGVQVASVVMLFAAAGLGIITLLIPVAYTWFTLAYAGVGFGFSLAYLVGLLRVGVAR
jgi:hypothetical protein